jgi:hypothetical protein
MSCPAIVITGVGATCRLSGYPEVVGGTATRAPALLNVNRSGTCFGNPIPADLSTGQRGELFLGTSDGCQALNEPTQTKWNSLTNTWTDSTQSGPCHSERVGSK